MVLFSALLLKAVAGKDLQRHAGKLVMTKHKNRQQITRIDHAKCDTLRAVAIFKLNPDPPSRWREFLYARPKLAMYASMRSREQ